MNCLENVSVSLNIILSTIFITCSPHWNLLFAEFGKLGFGSALYCCFFCSILATAFRQHQGHCSQYRNPSFDFLKSADLLLKLPVILKVKCISPEQGISELWVVICYIESHSVTCHSTQVNSWTHPQCNPSQTGRSSVYLPWRDGRPSWPKLSDCLRTKVVYLPTDGHTPIAVLTRQHSFWSWTRNLLITIPPP